MDFADSAGMNFDHFRGLYDDQRIDPVIVCNIERGLADALGARVTRVLLSSETIAKQKVRHPDLSADDYVALKPAILFGEVRLDGQGRAVILFVDRHRLAYGVRVYLKVTGDGRRIYAQSFCLLNEKKYRRELAKALTVVREHGQI
ncbi:MAG TPA: hypothetical protein VN018_01625 [Brevundimonas sp.]|nr:hypothetical protein [Brevundimonas sp.]